MKHVTDFIAKYKKAAQDAAAGSKIFPDTVLSTAALESDWGRSQLSRLHNNFHGMKAGSTWKGQSVVMATKEQDKQGRVYTVNARFRKYATPEEGFRGYIELLNQPRYRASGVFAAKSPAEQFEALKRGGYATDAKYVEKAVSVLRRITNTVVNVVKSNPGASVLGTGILFFF